ncbi:MAG: tetratricopeptide repeat protein [Gammaproteobacteria bacterium]|nr:tetratricopeptide repeat protein [Gammaproteobacteria bacterium]
MIDWGYMGNSFDGSLEKAHEHAEIYQRLSPNDAHTYRLFSRVYTAMGRYDEAERCVERVNDLGFCKGVRDAGVRERVSQAYKRAGLPLD